MEIVQLTLLITLFWFLYKYCTSNETPPKPKNNSDLHKRINQGIPSYGNGSDSVHTFYSSKNKGTQKTKRVIHEEEGTRFKKGKLVIEKLPEQYWINIEDLPNTIEVSNVSEIERFEKHKNKIQEIIVRVPYYYAMNERKLIGESNIYVPHQNTYINLEDEAMHYFKQLGLYPLKTTVKTRNKIYNIFYLAYKGIIGDMGDKIKKDVQMIINHVSTKDISQFARFIIGLPDFFVIDKKANQIFFLEVKSKYDTLRDYQKLWFIKNIIDFPTSVTYKILKFLPEKKYRVFVSDVVGLRYCCKPRYLETISKGEKVGLIRDLHNIHDKFAIKVIRKMDNQHIGFIPKAFEFKENIWEYLEKNYSYECYIEKIERLPPSCLNSHKIIIKIIFEL